MSQGGPADRRQHRRLHSHIPVRFGVEGRMCDGAIIDLSEGGLQIRSSDSFAAGVVLDVFVQFPRRRLRLRVRVAWVRGEPPAMGLSYIQPDRSLLAAYDEWVEETRTRSGTGSRNAMGAVEPAASAAPPASPAARIIEPAGPVVRHLETARGNQYDVRMEKDDAGWRVLIYTSPRSSVTPGPEVDRSFPDFASADAAFREFLKTH